MCSVKAITLTKINLGEINMKRFVKSLALVMVLVFILATPASAYNLLGIKIPKNKTFNMYFHNDYKKAHKELTTLGQQAINDWLSIDNLQGFIQVHPSAYTQNDFPYKDGTNRIYLQADKYDRYLGKAAIWHDGTYVVEADLNINAAHQWTLVEGDPNGMHYYSAMLHELGHLVGLDHSAVPESCMIASLGAGESLSIAEVDKQAFKVIYQQVDTGTEFASFGLASKEEEKKPEIQLSVFKLQPKLTLNDLVDISNLVIVGEAQDSPVELRVESSDGKTVNDYTQYNIKVDKILKNDIDFKGDNLNVRIECREAGNRTICDGLCEGKFSGKHVYFLLKPTTGGRFITHCDYYVLPYSELNVFKFDEEKEVIWNEIGEFSFDKLNCSINSCGERNNHPLELSLEESTAGGLVDFQTYAKMKEEENHYGRVISIKRESE